MQTLLLYYMGSLAFVREGSLILPWLVELSLLIMGYAPLCCNKVHDCTLLNMLLLCLHALYILVRLLCYLLRLMLSIPSTSVVLPLFLAMVLLLLHPLLALIMYSWMGFFYDLWMAVWDSHLRLHFFMRVF